MSTKVNNFDVIDRIITDCNLDDDFNPVSGDCASIAAAISNIWGGDIIVCYTVDDSGDITVGHFVVDINGVCVDGNGLYNLDVIIQSAPDVFDIDEDVFDYLDTIDRNVESYEIYDDRVRMEVEDRLRDKIEVKEVR